MLNENMTRKITLLQSRRVRVNDEDSENFLSLIDRGLDRYGDNVRLVVYYKFKEEFGLERKDIPRHTDKFIDTLNRFFGVCSKFVCASIATEIKRAEEYERMHTERLGEGSTYEILSDAYDQFHSPTTGSSVAHY